MELMLVILVIAITGVLGLDTISSYEANARSERAARECLVAFRYARNLAFTSGKNACVRFNSGTNSFSVYWQSNGSSWDASPVTQPMAQGQTYTVSLNTANELAGCTYSISPSATQFTYSALGSCDTAGTITFTFGNHTKQLVVALVGDPTVN